MGNTSNQKSAHFSGCISPSCVPVHNKYTRVNRTKCDRWSRMWRKLINKVIQESKKSLYGSTPKTLTFRYDAVSYSQNFDEGDNRREYYDLDGVRCSQVCTKADKASLHKLLLVPITKQAHLFIV
ncbi:hypothetical protein CTI12_AA210710 [Artemisia annua]|uniref:Uncharacterized protein n=1 Tax=Artemisia annua TaxID=35608 RepID=A0A2U1NZK1_ARTAN|nr:hypothetical protein CTI12_AA210710 [Artemisia annua]